MATVEEKRLAGAQENPLVEGLERIPVHPTTLVIFGATGDLAQRKLLPALYNLAHEGSLPERFNLIGVARRDLSDDDFRADDERVDRALLAQAPRPAGARRAAEAGALRGRHVRRPERIRAARRRPPRRSTSEAGVQFNRVFYLSTAPEFFPVIVDGARRRGPAPRRGRRGARRDREAVRLRPRVRARPEPQRCSTSSTSGRSTASTTTSARRRCRTCWRSGSRTRCSSRSGTATTSTRVQITAAEDIGIGTRAGYYDSSGALRDLVQNHMLQLLTLLCMEPPSAFSADKLRDEKVKVTQAIRAPTAGRGARAWRCARSTGPACRAASAVPGYLDEDGVPDGLDHRDLRGAAARGLQLALGRRAVLPAHRQAPRAPGDRDRRDAEAGAAPRLPAGRLGRRAAQPARAHGAARRGRVAVARGEDPGPAHADPAR